MESIDIGAATQGFLYVVYVPESEASLYVVYV